VPSPFSRQPVKARSVLDELRLPHLSTSSTPASGRAAVDSSLQGLMEDLPTGLILLDDTGAVTYANRFAKEVLSTDGIALLQRAGAGYGGPGPPRAQEPPDESSPPAPANEANEPKQPETPENGELTPLARFRFTQSGTGRRIEVVRYAAPEGTLLQLRDLSVHGNGDTGRIQASGATVDSGVEAMRRLSGGVAHDFNNILSVIRSHVQLLQEPGRHDPEAQAALQEIDESVTRAMDLTRRLLSFSQTARPRHRHVDVNDELRSMHGIITGLVRGDVEVIFRLSPEDVPVLMDPDQLEQVVLTLVISAGDSLPDGGDLEVATESVEIGPDRHPMVPVPAGPGRYVCVTVGRTSEAEGEGPREEGPESQRFRTNGTGALGLPSVYGIVEQAWGYVQGHSHPERGNAYRVYLPRADRGS